MTIRPTTKNGRALSARSRRNRVWNPAMAPRLPPPHSRKQLARAQGRGDRGKEYGAFGGGVSPTLQGAHYAGTGSGVLWAGAVV